jgi:UDP-N-acetylmuramate dehydrogenase
MILENYSLKQLNTFGIDVKAQYFATFHTIAELIELINKAKANKWKTLILGGGSNVLFTQNFEGIVLQNGLKGIEIVRQENEWTWVKAAAGENWNELVLWTIQNNFAGLENLSLIPGCVGAAPMQNIGAYGTELKDVFDELEAVEIATGNLKIFNNSACRFGYRESIFKHELKNQFVITAVTFKLKNLNVSPYYKFKTDYGDIQAKLSEMQVNELSLKAVSNAVIAIRQSKLPDPKELGNAGSFFKNPVVAKTLFEKIKEHYPLAPSYPADNNQVKVPAGWLIEQCGWKGKKIGNTGAHAKQALVLVNYGNASGDEIWKCAKAIQQSVFEKFGITIEPEVNVY